MKAWHFVNSTLRDGRPIPADGEKLIHGGDLEMCVNGLHASKRLIDALRYAPGSTICRVKCGGEFLHDKDKLVCTERTILWRINGYDILQHFARKCALDVVHLWDAPKIVIQYLNTGDKKLRDAAGTAAGAAAWDAAWATARDAAWATARDVQNRRLTSMVVAARKEAQ